MGRAPRTAQRLIVASSCRAVWRSAPVVTAGGALDCGTGSLSRPDHLPGKADPFIERVLAQIGSGCESLNAALSAEELMISSRGHVILRDDPAVTSERSDAELLRNQLYARVGRTQLTELLLAVDGETHFSWELLRRPPVAPEELVPVYAALFVAAER